MSSMTDPYGTGTSYASSVPTGDLDPYGSGEIYGPDDVIDGADPYGLFNKMILETTFKLRRGDASEWSSKNPVLSSGEPGYELDTHKMKIGDGVTAWSGLDYFVPTSDISSLIADLLINGNVVGVVLENHINSANPHPVYDDGPSLFLLYQNSKV